MITISPPSTEDQKWGSLSFASTLYLYPILDLLLRSVPPQWRPELRLGLQEALVNAAKHGNNLDPTKDISVRFLVEEDRYWWIISDQGRGFNYPCDCQSICDGNLGQEVDECGRGLFILHQIFDEVRWTHKGTELQLCKQFKCRSRAPLLR